MSVPYFVNPDLNFVFQGPEKKFPPLSGFELLAKTGNAYEARKNDPKGEWRKKAYGDSADNGEYASLNEARVKEPAGVAAIGGNSNDTHTVLASRRAKRVMPAKVSRARPSQPRACSTRFAGSAVRLSVQLV